MKLSNMIQLGGFQLPGRKKSRPLYSPRFRIGSQRKSGSFAGKTEALRSFEVTKRKKRKETRLNCFLSKRESKH
jgi:hypothetical protein